MDDERGPLAAVLADQLRALRGSGRFRLIEVTPDGYYLQAGCFHGTDVQVELYADDSDAANDLLAFGFTAPHDDSPNWTLEVPDASDRELDDTASALLRALTEVLGVPLVWLEAVLGKALAMPELTTIEFPAELRPRPPVPPTAEDDDPEEEDGGNPLIHSYRELAEALWDEPMPADSGKRQIREAVLSGLESYAQLELSLHAGSDSFFVERGREGVGHSFPLRLSDVLDSIDELGRLEYEPEDEGGEFDELDAPTK